MSKTIHFGELFKKKHWGGELTITKYSRGKDGRGYQVTWSDNRVDWHYVSFDNLDDAMSFASLIEKSVNMGS